VEELIPVIERLVGGRPEGIGRVKMDAGRRGDAYVRHFRRQRELEESKGEARIRGQIGDRRSGQRADFAERSSLEQRVSTVDCIG